MRTRCYALLRVFMFLAVVSGLSCGSNNIGTGVGNPSTGSKTSAALAALFSSDSTGQLVLEMKYQSICSGTPASCFCEEVIAGEAGVAGISVSGFGPEGTYGSSDDSLTLASTDFCADAGNQPQSGTGPDGLGLWGYLTIEQPISATCSDGSSFSFLAGSTGIHRNTESTATQPVYQPQLYGSFVVEQDGNNATLDCTLFLLEDGSIGYSNCTDESGSSINQETDVTCEF